VTGLFEGVPNFNISKEELAQGINVLDLLGAKTAIFDSKGEAKKMIQGGGVAVNRQKVTSDGQVFTTEYLVNGKFLVAQRGKKNYFLIIAE
jgi:tyrosyl-tRNA synthetase